MNLGRLGDGQHLQPRRTGSEVGIGPFHHQIRDHSGGLIAGDQGGRRWVRHLYDLEIFCIRDQIYIMADDSEQNC